MSTDAISGHGTKFYEWDTDGSSWNAVAEVSAISGPAPTRDTIEVTDFDSTNRWKEYIGGLRDGGTIGLTMNYTRAGYDKLLAAFNDDENRYYKVVFPDTDETTFEFEGLITDPPVTLDVADKVGMEATYKVSGEPTIGDGSSGSPV